MEYLDESLESKRRRGIISCVTIDQMKNGEWKSERVGGSFRDPDGYLISVDRRILRIVNASAVLGLKTFLDSECAKKWCASGQLVQSRILDGMELRTLLGGIEAGMVVEQERVPFPSFPYEWPPEMLYAAASLTLDLAEELLGENMGLKDATPYNILFRGPNEIFIDILSVEKRAPTDPTWLPYAQCVRSFLLPLLVDKYFGVSPDHSLLKRRDGLEPEEVYRMCGVFRKWLYPFIILVSIPKWFGSKDKGADGGIYRKRSVRC